MAETALPDTIETGAEDVRWDLTDLFPDEAALDAALGTDERAAADFADRYRGRLATLPDVIIPRTGAGAGDAAEHFAEMMRDLEGLSDRLGRAYTYAYLHWSTDTEDPARGALLQKVREAYTRAGQHLLFVDVEWAAMEDAPADALLAQPALEPYRHHLELKRHARLHVLTEPEEHILAEKAVTGWSAWNRLFDETLGAARFDFRGERVPLQQVLAQLHDTERETRAGAAASVTEGLVALERPLTFVFNTILADKSSTDGLRKYEHWLDSRNEANEIEAGSVAALVEAVTGRYELVQRFYRLKKRLLGLDEMLDYDRYAPLGEAARVFSWDEARDTVLDAYSTFLPEMGDIAQRFFDGRWIDAPPNAGKRGGAFSHGAVPSAHPYILLNYTGKARDVQTLAHELGHGVHQYLSRDQGVFHSDTPLTTAETASVFGEMLVFNRLIDALDDEKDRLALLVEKVDDSMATVFRQITMNRFEDRIHAHRRERGELAPDDLAEHWLETQRAMYGDSVTLTEGYRHWWSYIPHFVHTPGYVYAYAFGELLVLALHARYREEGPAFAARYRELLASGGSDWPHVLVARLGIDLRDPAFWDQGLDAVEAMVEEAEKMAGEN